MAAMKATALILAAAIGVAASGGAAAANLEVVVDGLRNGHGVVSIGVFASADTFPEGGRQRYGADWPAAEGSVRIPLGRVDPGTYAVVVMHDENANGAMDRNLIGLPAEGYAFSNGAQGVLGPPSFDAAAVTVGEDGATVRIRIRY